MAPIGITAVGFTLCESFSRTKKLNAVTPLFDQVGKFVESDGRDPMHEFTFSGSGDLPDGLIAGSDGGEDMAVSGITGGKTIIKSTDQGDSHEKWNSWNVAGENWPSAA